MGWQLEQAEEFRQEVEQFTDAERVVLADACRRANTTRYQASTTWPSGGRSRVDRAVSPPRPYETATQECREALQTTE